MWKDELISDAKDGAAPTEKKTREREKGGTAGESSPIVDHLSEMALLTHACP